MGVFVRLLFCLGGHSKQAGNEPDLLSAVSFVHPLHLALPHHVHDLVPLQGSPRCFEGTKAQSWLDQSFDAAMICSTRLLSYFTCRRSQAVGTVPTTFNWMRALG
jgi:hypothetical protein